jgi:hypothetical protein
MEDDDMLDAPLAEVPANLGNPKPKNKPRSFPFKNATRFQNKDGKTFFTEAEMNAALWEIALMEFGGTPSNMYRTHAMVDFLGTIITIIICFDIPIIISFPVVLRVVNLVTPDNIHSVASGFS